jgi:hypothetical protein
LTAAKRYEYTKKPTLENYSRKFRAREGGMPQDHNPHEVESSRIIVIEHRQALCTRKLNNPGELARIFRLAQKFPGSVFNFQEA